MHVAALDILALGGPVVWILALFSVIALTVTLVKIAQFWSMRDARAQLITRTQQLVESAALYGDALHMEVMRQARQTVTGLARYLRVLEVIATLAPLLGLLGTVLGMIEAFQAMEAAGVQVNPAVLSGGIWVALLTTAVGLAVAIPVSLVHSWLERRVEFQAELIQDDVEYLLGLQAARAIEKPDVNAQLKLA